MGKLNLTTGLCLIIASLGVPGLAGHLPAYQGPSPCAQPNGLFPNPADPHSFYNCDWGKGTLQYCPVNLVYNHAIKACDYPPNKYPVNHHNVKPTPTKKIYTTRTTTKSPKNPCYGGQNGPYPNPANPHSFFNCDWGHVYLQYCPLDLVYNHAIKACDYKNHPYGGHATTGPTTTTQTTKSPTIYHCYGQNGLYPNPADPHSFYNCDWGKGTLQHCPGNLVYKHSIRACDYYAW
ncbi:chondroitin proteoglycan 1-like [Pungitius pungitius]|uniref:chondroitin proteoglycan 1-like n=1 Tax=Pungitius pungitius TaxID=134920 RepID=UPI002E0F554C